MNLSTKALTYNPGLAAYKRSSVRSASPGQLVLALYDAAIASVARAAEADVAGDLETRGIHIDKAQAIIAELISSLSTSVDSPLPHSLFRIYNYVSHRIVDAALRNGTEALLEVKELLTSLRSAWAEAEADSR